MNRENQKAMFAKFKHENGLGVSLMSGEQAQDYYAKSIARHEKVVRDYNNAHDIIVKLTNKKYSNIGHGEYVRKVRHYHATIKKYKKAFDIEPNNVIRMS